MAKKKPTTDHSELAAQMLADGNTVAQVVEFLTENASPTLSYEEAVKVIEGEPEPIPEPELDTATIEALKYEKEERVLIQELKNSLKKVFEACEKLIKKRYDNGKSAGRFTAAMRQLTLLNKYL